MRPTSAGSPEQDFSELSRAAAYQAAARLSSLDISKAKSMPSTRAQAEGLGRSKIFEWPSSDVPKRDRRDAYPPLLCVLPGCGLRGFRGRAWLQS